MIKIRHICLIVFTFFVFESYTFAVGNINISHDSLEITKGGQASFNINLDNAAGRIKVETVDNNNNISIEAFGYEEKLNDEYFIDNGTLQINVSALEIGEAKVKISIMDVTTYDEEEITDDPYYVSIKVVKQVINSIEFEKLPSKLEYKKDSTELDLSGGIIKILYNDNSSTTINISTKDVDILDFNTSKIGKSLVKLKYLENEISYEISVVEDSIDSPSTFIKNSTLYLFLIIIIICGILYFLMRKKRIFHNI